MSVGDGQEHDELRQVVREFLRQWSPSREVRRLIEAGEGRDDEVWAMLTGQLGLSGIAVPVRYGGAGYGPVELGIVLEEMGRALLVAPYFSTVVLAGQALVASGDEDAMARWLPGIADGSLTAALAVAEESGSWDLADVTAAAEPDGDGWTVSGSQALRRRRPHRRRAPRRRADAGGHGVFAVEGDAPGVERARLDALDLTRPLASVALRDARAVRVGAGRDTAAWLSEVTDLVLAALAAEQLGGAARCLELSVEYAKRPRAVRPPDRLVPGHQAQVRHPAPRGRVAAGPRFPRQPRRSPAASRTRRSRRRSPTSTARPPSPTPPRSASRSTAASATPGSTTRTCTSGGRSRPSFSSARPRGSAPGWPRWPGSEGRR